MSLSVLVVGGDIRARERIRSAAGPAGADLTFASFGEAGEALASTFHVVILDLDDGREPLLQDVEQARAQGRLPNRVLGYYSHVDAALGEAAVKAGVEPVRRGVFWSNLRDLLTS